MSENVIPNRYPCEIIKIYHVCEDRIERSVQRITVCHYDACRVMTNGDPEGLTFYPTFTQLMDSFSSLPFNSSFSCLKGLQKVPECAEMRHDIMTSL